MSNYNRFSNLHNNAPHTTNIVAVSRKMISMIRTGAFSILCLKTYYIEN
ncbi:hypothetical protein LEP1GSC120_0957 [Leptospira santarosai str. 200702252]|nr:hypothetical protein LEP1GSC130_1898 [Leptospira santarosai str. 200403458]EMO99190.1 hypothetical protein LEP1GSC120_0957 [Leptospira santarosai str. 200702252]